MTVTLICLLWRKPGLTMEQYIDYYENTHMNVIREVTGSNDFPLSHTRHYVRRTENGDVLGGFNNPKTPAVLYGGSQDVVDFDCVAEIVFEDESAFQRFFQALSSPKGAARIAEDQEHFQIASKTTVIRIDQVTETRK
jgi:hypothetical protein